MDQSPLFLFATFEADEVRNGLKRWNWLSFKILKRQNTLETYFWHKHLNCDRRKDKPNKGLTVLVHKLLLSHYLTESEQSSKWSDVLKLLFSFPSLLKLKLNFLGLRFIFLVWLGGLLLCFGFFSQSSRLSTFWKVW